MKRGLNRLKQLLDKGIFARLSVLTMFLMLAGMGANAQSLEIKRVVQNKDVISIYYDLIDPNQENRYNVRIYSSKDQFTDELRSVEGAVGLAVDCGIDNRIDFNVASEYGATFGSVQAESMTFELRGELYQPFMTLQTPKKIRRGATFTLKSNVPGDTRDLRVDFIQNGMLQYSLVSASSNTLEIKLPTKARLGSGYRILVKDTGTDEYISREFEVVRRIPLACTIAGSAMVATAAVIFFTYEPPPPRLPDPAKPD